jgi:hypothetical protein
MFRWTVSSCRVWTGTFALLGLGFATLAIDGRLAARAVAAQSEPLPSTSLGQPGPPPTTLPKKPTAAKTAPAPAQPIPGQSVPAQPVPAQPSDAQSAQPQQSPAGPAIPGLGNLMTPNGIAIPGGVGFIRPGADTIGIQINTPDGPIEFTVPRRNRDRRARGPEQAVAPPATTDAPLFGQPSQPGASAPPVASIPGSVPEDRNLPGEPNAPDTARPSRGSREFAHISRLFHARNYPLVMRRLSRSLARDPGDRDLLQLRSLTYLVQGDFHSAYTDVVTVLAQDDVWDWSTLRSLFHAGDEYTALYRSLEDRVLANPNAIELRMLLAYHNLVLGHRDAARRHFERVVALDPSNDLARRMVTAEQPPQPRGDAGAMDRSRTAKPDSRTLVPIRARSKPAGSSEKVGGPVSIDLGEPTTAPPAKPAETKPGG